MDFQAQIREGKYSLSWRAQVFESDKIEDWIVSLDNYKEVLNVFKTKQKLGLVNDQAEAYLMKQFEQRTDCHTFCTYMVEYLKKQQSDLTDLGFKTTAQWITEMLKEIKQQYAGKDKESRKMNKKLLYAIDKLNSNRSIFLIDNVNFSDDEDETNEPVFMVQQ